LQERRDNRAKIRAEKQQQKELKKMARAAQKEVNKQLRAEQQRQKDHTKQNRESKKRKREPDISGEIPEPKTRVGRSGRNIALPTRFRA
jgi:hypothetical protein